MIIWNGFGLLVAVIGFGSLVLTEIVSERITGDDEFYQQNGWITLVGMLIAATLTYGLHRLLSLRKERIVIDKETGEQFALTASDSLFCVPVRWWPGVFVVIGLVFAVTNPGANARVNQPHNGPAIAVEQ